MSFGLYALGFAILIGGLIYAAYLVHMPTHWIVVGAIVLLGIGILSGVKATRQKDPAEYRFCQSPCACHLPDSLAQVINPEGLPSPQTRFWPDGPSPERLQRSEVLT
jgi:hypothetical protein